MQKKIKIIDLLCLISNDEEVPKRIKYNEVVWEYKKEHLDYHSTHNSELLFSDDVIPSWVLTHLNTEVEILEDKEDKEIPLIPDDELYEVKDFGIVRNDLLNYNFKVLKEKINQVVEEFNNYIKEDK